MASFDAYRSPAELKKLYLHCQYLAGGSSALRVFKHHSTRVAAAFLRAAIDIPAFGNAANRRRLLESVSRLALSIWQGVDGARDTVLLFVDCLLGTAGYQLPPDDQAQAANELQDALDSGQLPRITDALRFWK